MKKRKRNKMDSAQNLNGAAQELDMDALENVAGGRIEIFQRDYGDGNIAHCYREIDDDTGEIISEYDSFKIESGVAHLIGSMKKTDT